MTQYFNKFPTIYYNGSFAKNLLSRVDFTDITKNNIAVYYPYLMSEYERVDNLSYDYYGDADFAWLIMLSNGIVDPYYGMNISDDDFISLMNKKYGSIQNAYNTIYAFKTNWENDDRTLDQSGYDALPAVVRKYWAFLNPTGNKNIYVRKREDIYVSTNKIVSLPFTYDSGSTEFQVGERISQKYSSSLTTHAVVTNIDVTNNILTLKHYVGEFIETLAPASYHLTGDTSGASATLSASNISDLTVISSSFTADEEFYWKPISVFDYEAEINNVKREIVLVDKSRKDDIAKQVKDLLA